MNSTEYKENCGLLLIKEVDYNFPLEFVERFANLHAIIFPVIGIPICSFVNVLLCNRQRSTELNSRLTQSATDVLSWQGEQKKIEAQFAGYFPFGEIAICLEICQKQALENAWTFEVEFIRLLVHGLAHLGGYNHKTLSQEKKMLAQEKEILSYLKMEFVYP